MSSERLFLRLMAMAAIAASTGAAFLAPSPGAPVLVRTTRLVTRSYGRAFRPVLLPLPWLLHSSGSNDNDVDEDVGIESKTPTDEEPTGPPKKKKKRKKFEINASMLGSPITSEGLLEGRTVQSARTTTPRMGVPSKSSWKKDKRRTSQQGQTPRKPKNSKAAKIARQRTANGTVSSASGSIAFVPRDEQNVQIQVAKRGTKVVTILRGIISTPDEKRSLVKTLKSKLGTGGTLVDDVGVIELQGSHSDKVLTVLKSIGYGKARVVGGK